MGSACEPALPDHVIDGRWVRYHYWVEEGPPCQAAVDEIDHFVDLLGTYFQRQPPRGFRIDYFKLHPTTQTPQSCRGARACTIGNAIYSKTWTMDHEVTHAFLNEIGKPPHLFMEGIAVVLGCGPTPYVGDPLEVPELGALVETSKWLELNIAPYEPAGSFTRFLIDTYGLEAFITFYAKTPEMAKAGDIETHFAQAFGAGLADSLANWRARPAPRDGEFCILLDDRCAAEPNIALTAIGDRQRIRVPVSCIDSVSIVEVAGTAATVRVRFTAENAQRGLNVQACAGSEPRDLKLWHDYPLAGKTDPLSGRSEELWTQLLPGRYSMTVSEANLPLGLSDPAATPSETAAIEASLEEGIFGAGCEAPAVKVADDTRTLSFRSLSGAVATDGGVIRIEAQGVREVSIYSGGLAADPLFCSGCPAAPNGCVAFTSTGSSVGVGHWAGPVAQIAGSGSVWLLPSSDGGPFGDTFAVDVALSPP